MDQTQGVITSQHPEVTLDTFGLWFIISAHAQKKHFFTLHLYNLLLWAQTGTLYTHYKICPLSYPSFLIKSLHQTQKRLNDLDDDNFC